MFASILFAAVFAASVPEIRLLDAEDRPFDSHAVSFSIAPGRSADGAAAYCCRLEAKGDIKTPLRLKLAACVGKTGKSLKFFDGRSVSPLKKGIVRNPIVYKPSFVDGFGMFGAVWDGRSGIALGTGADGEDSFVELATSGDDSGASLTVTVNAALMRKGSVYECSFVVVEFDPKYGERDALARYYSLYPERFRRNPKVNKEVFGVCASYQSWNHANPDMCRWADATWEWCIGSCRHWGDILNVDNTTAARSDGYQDYTCTTTYRYWRRDGKGVVRENVDMTRDEFAAMLDERYSNAYYCGVVNGCYMMAMSNFSNILVDRYPDSLETGNPVYPNPYPFSTYVWAFPECSWGQELRRQIAERMKRDDFGCIAFDVSAAGGIYRGVRLTEMRNVGWDGHGPGVARGIANGKLCDFVSSLPSKRLKGNMASAVNTCPGQLNDVLHADMIMIEQPPWNSAPPYPRPFRYAAGEKGITFWEGYDPRSFDPNFHKWPAERQKTLLRDLSRYAVHQQFRWGVSLPASFLTEYVSWASKAFSVLNEAGWKPVPGAAVPDGFDVARYGLGAKSYLAVNNLERKERVCSVRLHPQELHDGIVSPGRDADPVLFAPFYGGEAENKVDHSGRCVSCTVGAHLANVLEGVGTAQGSGKLRISWSGDFTAARLKFSSDGFSGKIHPRESFGSYRAETGPFLLGAGETREIVYGNSILRGQAESYGKFPFASAVSLIRAADGESKDMAERVAFFYRRAAGHNVAISVDAGLPPRTVRFVSKDGALSFTVSAEDRMEFSVFVKRILDAINGTFFPKYRHEVEMLPEERKHFVFIRH